MSLFINSLRNDGNTHSAPPYQPHSHGNCTIWTNTLHAISVLHSPPLHLHILARFFLLSVSHFSIRPAQDKCLILAKKIWNVHMEYGIWTEFSLVIFSVSDGFEFHAAKGQRKKKLWIYLSGFENISSVDVMQVQFQTLFKTWTVPYPRAP